MIIALVAMFMLTFTTASAMSYEQARQQALFLTDKMAYELNLTDDQYEAAYEVNLDYLMGINTQDELYGTYWRQRNIDLQYILLDWQYQAFMNATYFYRPLYWDGGFFHFGIYARYPRRDYFFFGRPAFYATYRGGHCWRMNGGRSWYHGREFGRPQGAGNPRIGMRDGFNRGDFGRGKTFGYLTRESSTRTTVTRPGSFGSNNSRPEMNRSNGTFGNSSRSFGSGNSNNSRSNVFGGNRSSFGSGNSNNSRSSFGGGNNGGFTPRSTGSSSFGSGRSSFGGGGGNSFGGGNSRSNGGSFGGGSHSNGGGHFGGRR